MRGLLHRLAAGPACAAQVGNRRLRLRFGRDLLARPRDRRIAMLLALATFGPEWNRTFPLAVFGNAGGVVGIPADLIRRGLGVITGAAS